MRNEEHSLALVSLFVMCVRSVLALWAVGGGACICV